MSVHVAKPTIALGLFLALVLSAPALAADTSCVRPSCPFLGDWALILPGGGAGWLGVEQKDGGLKASILWGGGSVLPLDTAKIEGGQLVLTRAREGRGKDAQGKLVKVKITQTITARVAGERLELATSDSNAKGKAGKPVEFTGKKIPPLGPAPELARVKFGQPIALLGGKDLSGWKLTNAEQPNGWSVKDGILINRPVQVEGKPHKRYGNLRTEREFEDFNLKLETRLPQGGNSGIYLRGIYEVQVADTFGRPLDAHNMGGIYSRICPTAAAEKPAGQWQTLDITLVDRHVTVILNGKKIIDNQPLRGCTGGALWSDEFRPGPLYLQGDHTGVDYRNIVLRPVVK
jgi:hypothetical protein